MVEILPLETKEHSQDLSLVSGAQKKSTTLVVPSSTYVADATCQLGSQPPRTHLVKQPGGYSQPLGFENQSGSPAFPFPCSFVK